MSLLKKPIDPRSYEGTIVKVLPNESYPKKYWNKKHYIERGRDINGHPYYYFKESLDGINGWYGSLFFDNAIEGIHYEYIKGNPIYNSIGNVIRIGD